VQNTLEVIRNIFQIFYRIYSSPARVVQFTWAPCAVQRDARSVPLVRSSNPSRGPVRHVRLRKSNYLKIIPMHMMIREIIPGRQQRVRRCPL